MVKKEIKVINELGMHMRPAGILAKRAMAYNNCDITLRVNGKSVNAKALMQIMSAGVKCGNTVEIICDGMDEEMALDELVGLFEGGFGE
ncbi:MAG: HPr family phosphocarrier protein [Lachnospiraceae bacterium]|nr:HPr family phosphocarrier protein [Lachnospiraceae bacterium]